METIKKESITPAKAQQYLDHNKGNRALRSGAVEKYAADMKAGGWTSCIAPIAFYENGDIADGQHRLWAIIESDTPQEFFVLRGVPREAGINIDTGRARNVVDNAHIAGLDIGITVSTNALSFARAIEIGTRTDVTPLSSTQRLEILKKHKDAVQFALSHGTHGKGLGSAPVNAAIARAWYVEEDKERLQAFGGIVSKGFANGDADSAAIALRNYLLSSAAEVSSAPYWRDTFLKTQHAVYMFMQGRKLHIIKAPQEEKYPLPASMVTKLPKPAPKVKKGKK